MRSDDKLIKYFRIPRQTEKSLLFLINDHMSFCHSYIFRHNLWLIVCLVWKGSECWTISWSRSWAARLTLYRSSESVSNKMKETVISPSVQLYVLSNHCVEGEIPIANNWDKFSGLFGRSPCQEDRTRYTIDFVRKTSGPPKYKYVFMRNQPEFVSEFQNYGEYSGTSLE